MITLPDTTNGRFLIDPMRVESVHRVRESTTRIIMQSGKDYLVPLPLETVLAFLERSPHATSDPRRHEPGE